ncbi:zinc-dependent alcohol dehydrogenase family protein [Nonomuraea rhodomycinica]|uniref:Zinc-dependent alcohol dehydrogenase family protein n=1 Tax=Nonomuraea rhodomycinica TaxID=1712872 RepID=A0A7Y6IYX9_9ACTN|nr:zinc-dependent alcohol dehydrogenase family protein [Nonomuraea rhodomycinica]NUW46976.1 zinc-dependent alcohol dehydrogenase family protein [Nonomuraea rhodomycinica]
MANVVVFDELGGPEVLRLTEVPLPEPGEGEARVRVEAIGLNRAEALFRAGGYYYQPTLPASRLGSEAAGVVEAVGPGVEGFAPGDAVSVLSVGMGMSRHGVYGDRAVVTADTLLPRPEWMDARTGAAIWLSHLTAYGALFEVGRLQPGDHVLVTAASSSVGTAALQLARQIGAVPIAVTRTAAKADRLLRAGAAHVVATDRDDLAERVREITGGEGARVVFDPVGGPGLADLARTVAEDGALIVYGWLDPRPAPLPMTWPLNVHGYGVHHVTRDAGRMRRARAFITAGLRTGALTPVIDRTFDLADIAEAHRYMEADGQVGKIVVTVRH